MKLTISHLEAAYRLGLETGDAFGRNRQSYVQASLHNDRELMRFKDEELRQLEDDYCKRRWWKSSHRRDFLRWRKKLEEKAILDYDRKMKAKG